MTLGSILPFSVRIPAILLLFLLLSSRLNAGSISEEEIPRLAWGMCAYPVDPIVYQRVGDAYLSREPEGKEVLLMAYQNLLAEGPGSAKARGKVIELLAVLSDPEVKQLLWMEVAEPTAHAVALSAANSLRQQDLSQADLDWLTLRAITIDADIAQVDPVVIRCPECPIPPVQPAPWGPINEIQAARYDLYLAACDALRADPACAGLSSAISNAQIAFDRPETRPRIVQYISQSDSASIRQSFKDGTKLLRKLAHELEKEKSIKPYVLREIRKNFDPSDPGTQTLEQLVNDLSEDQLRQILNAILPMNEDQMMSVVDKMREGIAGILRAEEAQKAAAWAAAMREQWRQAWIQSRYPPRPSVGRALLETVASKR